MGWIDRIRAYAYADRGKDVSAWRRFLHYEVQVWYVLLRRLYHGPTLMMSSALSFRTIFAIVPILVLALLMVRTLADVKGEDILSSLLEQAGFSEIEIRHEIQRLEADTQPGAQTAPGEDDATATQPTQPADDDDGDGDEATRRRIVNLAKQVEALVDRVASQLTLGRVGPLGAVVLIWTALTLLITMEGSLNAIFETRNARPWGHRILLYWAVITLAPVLIGPAEYAASLLLSRAEALAGTGVLMAMLAWVARLAATTLVVAAIYKWLPYTRVSWWCALRGGLVASVLWNIAKWGFSLYLTSLVGAGNVYGVLGLLPLFLFWVNLSWITFIAGAIFTHTTDNLRDIRSAQQAQDMKLTPSALLAVALAVARPWQHGRGPASLRGIESDLNVPRPFVCSLVDRLTVAGILCPVGPHEVPPADEYTLARPAEKIDILEVLSIESAPDDARLDELYCDEIRQRVQEVRRLVREKVGSISLASLVRGE